MISFKEESLWEHVGFVTATHRYSSTSGLAHPQFHFSIIRMLCMARRATPQRVTNYPMVKQN